MASVQVHNSLKPGGPVPFVPREPGKVSWYACGPTVYDISHLGHARNYVSTDIIRRIMMHYFGYDVNFVMNITDIDDKIIIKARRKRLFELEKKKSHSPHESYTLGLEAFRAYATANLPLLHPEDELVDESSYQIRRDAAYGHVLDGSSLTGEGKPGDAEAKLKMHINNMDAAAQGLKEGHVFEGAEEILLPYLDSLYKETIDINDQTIYTDLTQSMEKEFTADMDALNVLRPDNLTRVTEYLPQIVTFVERLVQKGYAYESEGSVYFDITAFEKDGNTYARLRPQSKNDKALQEEGEGSLSKASGGKKGSGDFALWKKSKPGEPYWQSPWSNGRPGWHIECSVMASDKLGEQMDIHSGGIDLAFPHHDNELAQSEAFHRCGACEHTWVNYFLHIGHLSVSGAKMSKSLKNFQSIRAALETTYSARNMRIVFLLGRWNDGVEISPEMRKHADAWESTLNNFFMNIKARQNAAALEARTESLSVSDDPSNDLTAKLKAAQKDLDGAFRNSFDTPAVMHIIARIVRDANVYLGQTNDLRTVEMAGRWVTKIIGILGLDASAQPPYEGLGWSSATAKSKVDPKTAVKPFAALFANFVEEIKKSGVCEPSVDALFYQSPEAEFAELEKNGEQDPEILATPYVLAVSRLRDELRRQIVLQTFEGETRNIVIALSDRVRDYDLTDLGVQLDDQSDRPSLIKFVPAELLIAARNEKHSMLAEKAAQKEKARIAREKAEAEKWAKAKIPAEELFKNDPKYNEWDADGLPTKRVDGEEIAKSQHKKLKKDWERQKKLHAEYITKFGPP